MSDKVFLDTNIIVYAHTDHDITKQQKAQSLIIQNETTISTQVLQEVANVLKKKLKQDYKEISLVLSDLILNHYVHINNASNILKACEIADQYGFSFYDSLIISSALVTGAEILYSEDMQHEQRIEGKMTIVNLFL